MNLLLVVKLYGNGKAVAIPLNKIESIADEIQFCRIWIDKKQDVFYDTDASFTEILKAWSIGFTYLTNNHTL